MLLRSGLAVLAAALALAALLVIPGYSKTLRTFDASGWNGGAYSDDKTGSFSHCAASGSYKSGVVLFLWLYSDFNWELGFFHEHWEFEQGKEYIIRYRFDGGPWFDAKSYATHQTMLRVSMPREATLIGLFRRAYQMDIRVVGNKYGFNLTNTGRMVTDLAVCVQQYAGETAPSNPVSETDVNPETNNPSQKSSSGTGIFITAHGLVLTNHHVVEGCTALRVGLMTDFMQPATVLKLDKANDLALIKTKASLTPDAVAHFSSRPIKAGETIAIFGFPLAGTLSSSGNIVAGNITSLAGLDDDARMFQLSAPIQPGNSGGPLLDMSGNVIGVVRAKLNELAVASEIGSLPQNVNFAIKGNVVRSFLEAHSINFSLESNPINMDLSDVADVARKFTARIECAY